ncbi:MAG: ATP-dependent helicase [Thermoanaerobaculia bacterium]|nr:ATP-dependent helicase [Thermoanaerobaculia bacterium]
MPASARPATADAELNEAQLRAVRSLEGPQLVIAGAGSGKTRTLVHRVAHLVDESVDPEAILLLTFTRRAAHEMLQRAARLLDDRCQRVAGGTFHGFANQVLRRWAPRLEYGRQFTILDRADASEVVGTLRTELGLDRRDRRFPRKDTLTDLFSKQVNTNRPLAALIEDDYPQFVEDLEPIRDLQQRFQERKRAQNVMDYDDLLLRLRDLLVGFDDVRERLSLTYRYIMVDEYQDTNRLQAHIAALLASRHGNLMVVGDDAQSIYSFRGASFRNIMDFTEVFPDTTVTVLEENYRSTQPILDLGNRILDSAREKYAKNLFTRREGGELPVFVRTPDDHDQAAFICDRILELREEGEPLAGMAVLSRAAWHTNSLEIELGRRNIPVRKFGGIRFVEAAHVKDVTALLRIAANPLDGMSWMRTLRLLEGVGPRRAQQMTELVLRAAGDPATAFTTHFRAARYGKALERLTASMARLTAGDTVGEQVATALELYKPLLDHNYDDARRRSRDLDALVTLAERYNDLERFLTDLAIDAPEFGRDSEGRDADDEWITVSTVHSAKGLEWDTVFVVNLVNGQFPIVAAAGDVEAFEEERRLFYVAVTRCRRNLFLLKPEVAPGRGWMGGVAELSPLVSEIRGFDRLTRAITFTQRREEPGTDPTSASAPAPRDSARLSRIQSYFDGDG